MQHDIQQAIENLAAQPRSRQATAAAFAHEVLRDAILGGVLAPGEALRQEELAAALGLSRMPVREAIRLLEAQGLVSFSPHRGAVVAQLLAEEAEEIFEIRAALETLALRRAIPKLTQQALDEAEMLLGDMRAEGDPVRYFALHRRFHLALLAPGVGQRFLSLLEAQFEAAERYLRLERFAFDNGDEDEAEHRALLDACRAGDVAAACAIIPAHVAETGRLLAESLRRRMLPTKPPLFLQKGQP